MSESTPLSSDQMCVRLRQHAQAWGVDSNTPDIDVFNETDMARECARAADRLDSLLQDLARYENAHKVLVAELEEATRVNQSLNLLVIDLRAQQAGNSHG